MKHIEIYAPRTLSVTNVMYWLLEKGFPPTQLLMINAHESGREGHTFVYMVNAATLGAVESLCFNEHSHVYIGGESALGRSHMISAYFNGLVVGA